MRPYRFASSFTGLLDTYGSATGAWSVRWLNSAYTGALVRIRRSSDNAEKDFYPDSNNELSMSSEDGAGTSLSTWISTDSGYIRYVYGQETAGGTGSGNDIGRSTAADQPRIVNAGTLETDPTNGNVAFFCDGSSDYLSLGTSIATTQLFYSSFVFNRSSTAITSTGLSDTGATPHVFYWNTGDDIRTGLGTNTLHDSNNTSTGDFLFTVLRDSSNNCKYWINGSAQTTQTYANSVDNMTTMGNRNGQLHNGYWQEHIYWNSDQESNRSGIETDVNGFFSIW